MKKPLDGLMFRTDPPEDGIATVHGALVARGEIRMDRASNRRDEVAALQQMCEDQIRHRLSQELFGEIKTALCGIADDLCLSGVREGYNGPHVEWLGQIEEALAALE